jgi:hypothetical protein
MATTIVNQSHDSIPATPEQIAMIAYTRDMSLNDQAHVLAIGLALVAGKPKGQKAVPLNEEFPMFFRKGGTFDPTRVTPLARELMMAYAQLEADDQSDADRMMRAMESGAWKHNMADIVKMTRAQRRAIFDALPA